MNQQVKAVYRKGAFVVQQPFDLPEEAQVNLIVEGPVILPPEITDHEERTRVLQRVSQRMKQNPLPAEAPRFTREELHERR